jgi:hypothetical protein
LFFKKWKAERKEEKETRTFFRRTEKRARTKRERERESGKFYLSFSPMSENTCVARVFCASFFFGFFENLSI